jgi:sec-independent protein translocase protein TatA
MVGDILQPTHLLFVLVIALLVLGPKRLPEVGRQLGNGLRDFRAAINGEHTEHHGEIASDPQADQRGHEFAHATETAPLAEKPELARATPTVATEPVPVHEAPTVAGDHEFAHDAAEPAEKHEFAYEASEPATKRADPLA